MTRWNGAPDHAEPYDPGCPCGTCAGYAAMVEEEEYQRRLAEQEAEEAEYMAWEAEQSAALEGGEEE